MMKKFFLLCCFFAVTLSMHANGWIHFQVGYNNPLNTNKGIPRTPIQPPAVYLEDYTLSFDAFEEDCVIKLLDEGEVVYEVDIPAGSTSVILPSTLSGEYTLQLFKGNWVFEGEIEL